MTCCRQSALIVFPSYVMSVWHGAVFEQVQHAMQWLVCRFPELCSSNNT